MTGNPQKPLPETTVLIIGAGLAGLYAGYLLRQADIPYRILESEDHAGGRVFSRPALESDLTLDEGANLINSTDRIAIRLMNDFGIRYVRRVRPGSDSMHYLFGAQELDEDTFNSQVFAESQAALSTIVEEQREWSADEERATNPRFIDESIANYLNRIGAGPLFTSFMQAFSGANMATRSGI